MHILMLKVTLYHLLDKDGVLPLLKQHLNKTSTLWGDVETVDVSSDPFVLSPSLGTPQ